MSEAQAQRIARQEDARYVHAQIASYKATRGKKGPGWFVRAVEEHYDLRTTYEEPPVHAPKASKTAKHPKQAPVRPLIDDLDDYERGR